MSVCVRQCVVRCGIGVWLCGVPGENSCRLEEGG